MNGAVEYLHKDQLGSVKLITAADGSLVKTSTYAPFGEVFDETLSLTAAGETKGNTCERFDADAGLQYLNARYYDPRLGLFIQPDWLDPTQQGVGLNRYSYSYSFNDPVNLSDPNGNFINVIVGAAVNVALDAAIASRTGQSFGLSEVAASAAAGGLAGAAGTGAFQIAHKAIKLTKAAPLAKVGAGVYAGAAAQSQRKRSQICRMVQSFQKRD
ncbi:MAG: RHS repeat-associated core domain-containing protein [Alphaproteobacteria bacterium]|nr:RHS repeat-associated core domain-containing protein [Alphaproteobacteria bacterium]MBU1828885.1 RHS repeat-associated core domain-containing protein [Alphaproteobacteria bacterium]MBU2243877.1 RHS repeat-associated core domain-containing protein [Alphaproteobacteria bacterium]